MFHRFVIFLSCLNTIGSLHTTIAVSKISVLFNHHNNKLSVYKLCETIVLNNGTEWKTESKAATHDIAEGEMVLICPACNVAYVVKDRVVEVVAPI